MNAGSLFWVSMNRFSFICIFFVLGLVLSCSNSEDEFVDVDEIIDVSVFGDSTIDSAIVDTATFDTISLDTVATDTSAADTSVVDTTDQDTTIVDTTAAADTPIVVAPEPYLGIYLTKDSLHEGMVRVSSNDNTIYLGTNDPSAKANERPMMRVKLTYDYSIAKHEVTCREYSDATRGTEWFLDPPCSSDSVAMAALTYYDAVLYANLRSKAEGYDTAYSYLSRTFGVNGECVSLEGLTFRTDVDAYRLPTEAEWILAASQEWSSAFGWNDMTSGHVLHDVCTMPTDTAWFCDFEGNVIEMTNDWLGMLKDTTVVNYVGAPVANSLSEKVVKGGAITKNYTNTNLYSRGDVYAVTASTELYYMGFRLAFGAIPNPQWMDDRGRVASSQPVLVSSADVFRRKLSTIRTKLAFRNDMSGNLAYVDYYGGLLKVNEITDTMQVYHPEISPDGMKVAFCTGVEGVKGNSTVYVRNLDPSGNGLVKLNVPSAAIPRWVVDKNGDTAIVYVDNAGDNSSDADFMQRGTWKVSFRNGQFGVPQKLFDGAYHGGVSADEKFAVSGSRKLRVHTDGMDDVWYNGEQACNVSLSKAGDNRVLFLDFGGKTGRSFAGESYGTHERLLVANSKGDLVQTIPSPLGYAFDHSEWVSRENFAVVTLSNAEGAHTKIALVDLNDSSVTELVEGEELWHPSLWIKGRVYVGSQEIDLDSAGAYRDVIYEDGEKAMNAKMRMFWDMRDSIELIVLGSSRAERGFDPAQMSMNSLNFGFIGGDLWSQLYLAYHYILPHLKNLKYIAFEISPDLMKNSRLNSSDVVYGRAPGYYYDRNHNFWVDGVTDEFIRIVDDNVVYSHEDSTNYVNTRGLLKLEAHGWGGEPNVMRDSMMSTWEMNLYNDVTDSLAEFIDSTRNSGVTVIGIVYPQSPKYANTGSFGLHGTQRSVAMETIAYFDSLAQVYPHFVMMDENKFGMHDYTDDMAYDFDHLSELGAEYLSVRLDSLIRSLPGRK